MKQITFLKTMLLAVVLLVGNGMANAAEVLLTELTFPSYNDSKVGSYTASWTATKNAKTWEISNYNNNNDGWAFIKAGNKTAASTATINTSFSEKITKLVVTVDALTTNNITSIKLYVANNSSYTGAEVISVTKATGDLTFSIGSPIENGYYKFEVVCTKGSSNGLITVSKLAYYEEATSSCTSLATPIVTATPGNTQAQLSWDAVPNAASYTLSWNGGSAETVTSPVTKTGLTNGISYSYSVMAVGTDEFCATNTAATGNVTPVAPEYTITQSSNNESWGTVSRIGLIITGAPAAGYRYANPAYTVLSGTATVSQSGDAFTVTPAEDCAVQINFEIIPTYTVTFEKGTGICATASLTESSGGAGVILPSATANVACAALNWEFAGWATATQAESTTAPTLLAAGSTYYPESNVSLYAVYKKTEGGGSSDVTFNVETIAAAESWTNGTQYSSYTISPITITYTGGGNDGKYYSSDKTWRSYKDGGSVTISSSGVDISAVVSDPDKTFTEQVDKSWKFSATANTNFKSFVVTVGSSTTTYNSNPSCNDPSIVVTETALSGFTYAQGAGPSAEQTFTVSAVNLTNDISIAASTNYEISKTSGSDYATPLTFTPTEGTVAETTVYVRLKAGLTKANYNEEVINITSTGAVGKTITCNGSVTTPEATNHATALNATANSISQITVDWADASGGQVPDGYLVKASKGTPTAPVDGTAEIDGDLVKNITQGTQTAIFTGLDASTTYNFAIWPYNGTGTEINYKTDGTTPTASTATAAPIGIPVAAAVTDITANSFTANWNAVIGATSYELNVYTKTAGANATDLFISEYIEGSSNNKAIEIYNGTGNAVDLSNYSVETFPNGASTALYSLSLTGMLGNNEVYVIYNSGANSGIKAVGDIESTVTFFNGNDAVVLKNNGIIIDVFGRIGEDPGSYWGSDLLVTAERTLVRKSSVTGGVTTNPTSGFPTLATEWDSYNQDESSYLGSHTFSGGISATPIANSPFTITGTNSKALSGLTQGTQYFYTVVAKNATEISAASNEISASTTLTNIEVSAEKNASTLPDCPTCDLVVASGGELTIDANKTFNSVTVAPGAKLTLADTKTLTGTLILQSNTTASATFIDNNASPKVVTATVKQTLPAASIRTWWYLTSPVSGADWSVFGTNKVGDYSEATRAYSDPFVGATALTAGKGYVVKMTAEAAGTYQFENKVLNTGDITVNLTRTVTGTLDNKRGFNLVGNPYPSYLDFGAAYTAATNVRSTIWYRTGSGESMAFHTYNAASQTGSPTSATKYLPPMQAFWVKVDTDPVSPLTESTGTLNLTNAMRSHDESATGNPLKAPTTNNRQLIRLTVSNGTVSDETVFVSHPSASDNFDKYDSEKMSNNDPNRPEIYSLAGNRELVINGVNALGDQKQFALGFRTGKTGNYSIALTESSNLDDMEIVVRDKTESREWILTASNDYQFASNATTTDTRFSLMLRVKGSVTGFDELRSNLSVVASQGKIRIQSLDLAGASVRIYNSMGQKIYDGKAQSNTLNIEQTLAKGVYVVKVNNELRKVIVR